MPIYALVGSGLIEQRIACGTGIFTRALLADPSWNARIKEIRAVEPSQGMRDVFSRSLKDQRIILTDGVFQSTGVEDGWADFVIVAQVWVLPYTKSH